MKYNVEDDSFCYHNSATALLKMEMAEKYKNKSIQE